MLRVVAVLVRKDELCDPGDRHVVALGGRVRAEIELAIIDLVIIELVITLGYGFLVCLRVRWALGTAGVLSGGDAMEGCVVCAALARKGVVRGALEGLGSGCHAPISSLVGGPAGIKGELKR